MKRKRGEAGHAYEHNLDRPAKAKPCSAATSAASHRRSKQSTVGRPSRGSSRAGHRIIAGDERKESSRRTTHEPPNERHKQSSISVMAGVGRVEARLMDDSSHLLKADNITELRRKLDRDGYLLLKDILPRGSVTSAYTAVMEALAEVNPHAFETGEPPARGISARGAGNLGLIDHQEIAHLEPVLEVLEHPTLRSLAQALSQEKAVITTWYKWLRAVGRSEFTGVHTDRVFLGKGSDRLLTVWIPMAAVPPEKGGLMVCRGSHRLRSFARLRAAYGSSTVGPDGTASGWLSNDGSTVSGVVGRYAVDWRIATYSAGDVVVLGLDTLHMSAANTSSHIRVSCDTRWQPACDVRDPRLAVWCGENGPMLPGDTCVTDG